MPTTSAADLLDRATRLTRTLRDTRPAITVAQWETFDATFHRVLHETLGTGAQHVPPHDPDRRLLKDAADSYPTPLRPPAAEYLTPAQVAHLTATPLRTVNRDIADGTLHAVREGPGTLVLAGEVDHRADLHAADPTDPHPLARLSVTLGALADLLHDARTRGTPLLNDHGETARAVTHLASLGLVAAEGALAVMAHSDAEPPFRLAQYGERLLAVLASRPVHRAPLDLTRVVADAPTRTGTPAGTLYVAIYDWRHAIDDELAAAVPNSDTLRVLAQQSAHLVATTLTIRDARGRPDQPQLTDALNTAGRNLRDAARPWRQLTTLTRPGHAIINASRHLLLTLEQTVETLPGLTPEETSDLLTEAHRGLAHATALMDRTATLPDRLVRSGLLFAAARRVAPHVEHLAAVTRGRYVPVQERDVPDLAPTWRRAVAALDWAVVAERTTDHSSERQQHNVISIHR